MYKLIEASSLKLVIFNFCHGEMKMSRRAIQETGLTSFDLWRPYELELTAENLLSWNNFYRKDEMTFSATY